MKSPHQTAEGYWYDKPELHVARHSAEKIVPLLIEISHPGSVVDVGCGIGFWLAEFIKRGVSDASGLDGSWIKPQQLVVAPEHYIVSDLNIPKQALARLDRKFDLVLCLEVAEHLAPETADDLVDGLTGLGDFICFSAAIPGQRGFQHINERWQSYWAAKFEKRGFQIFDIIRPQIAGHADIPYYYQQNILVYAGVSRAARCKEVSLLIAGKPKQPRALDYVTVQQYQEQTDPQNYSLRQVMRVLPHLVSRALVSRFRRK